MDKTFKFSLPSPNFSKNAKDIFKPKPHFLTPSGMSLLPREKQPPPMYGKRGATVPSKYLKEQKLTVDVTTLPPPKKQYCEPCDLELHSIEDLKRHRAQHEKCPVEDCLYKGHPAVMDKHIIALHSSGLFDKFKKLSTPGEIAAWREERRKKYPTLANVLLKQKAQEQRQKRGERIVANKSRFGKLNDRKRAHSNRKEKKNNLEDKKVKEEKAAPKNKRNRNRNKRNQKGKIQDNALKDQSEVKQCNKEEEDETELIRAGIKMFRGTTQLKNYKHFNGKKKVTSNVLFALVGMYGSDDDESAGNDEIEHEEDQQNSDKSTKETTREECEPKKNVDTDNENNLDWNSLTYQIKEKSRDKKLKEVFKDIAQNFIDAEKKMSTPNQQIINKLSAENIVFDKIKENQILNYNENPSDEAPEETPIQRSLPHNSVIESNNNSLNKEPPTNRSKPMEQPKTSKPKSVKKKYGLDYRKARLRKQNTLLEKLLDGDIRHERNVLLQCVRFVCQKNFFGIR